MSGVGMTPATDAAVTDATSANAPAAPQGTAQVTSGQKASGDVLTQSEWTRRLVVIISTITVALSEMAIVGVMCYRVYIDGNSSLTNDITTKLLYVAIAGILSMTAALFGSNSLLTKLMEKVVP